MQVEADGGGGWSTGHDGWSAGYDRQPSQPVPGEKRPHLDSGPPMDVHAGPGDIRRGPFQARSIACAQCKIWQQLEQQPQCQAILDVDIFCEELSQLMPLAHAPVRNEWVVFSVVPEKKKCTVFLTMKGVWGATGEVFAGKKKSPKAAADYTNEIRITVQSSGKTSTSGCLDRDMLLEAHQCLAFAIRQAHARMSATLRPPSVAAQVALPSKSLQRFLPVYLRT